MERFIPLSIPNFEGNESRYVKNQIKEINEAISAGQIAEYLSERILDSLNSAENWGTWDLIGGGLVADLAKHSHLDTAQDMVEDLQIQLRNILPFRFFNVTFTCSRSIQVMVVHQDEHAVLGALHVYFQHVHPHIDGTVDGFQRIFRIVAPVGTVSYHDDAAFVASQELFPDSFGSSLSRLFGTCGQCANARKEYKQCLFHT